MRATTGVTHAPQVVHFAGRAINVGSGQPAVGRLTLLHWQHVGDGGTPAPVVGEENMSWKRPKIREICIGMEINGYLPADL